MSDSPTKYIDKTKFLIRLMRSERRFYLGATLTMLAVLIGVDLAYFLSALDPSVELDRVLEFNLAFAVLVIISLAKFLEAKIELQEIESPTTSLRIKRKK